MVGSLRLSDKQFHIAGPATEKARGPVLRRWRGTTRRPRLAEVMKMKFYNDQSLYHSRLFQRDTMPAPISVGGSTHKNSTKSTPALIMQSSNVLVE